MTFLVVLRVPDHKSTEEIREDLMSSVEFGHPEFHLQDILWDSKPAPS